MNLQDSTSAGTSGDAVAEPEYTYETIGQVGCDDDSFCGVVVNVRLSDSGQRIKRMSEVAGESPPEHAWMLDMPVHDPVKIRIDWEENCTSEPGLYMGRHTAVRLANLLLEAACYTPRAHRHPSTPPGPFVD